MGEIFTSFVSTNRRWTPHNIGEAEPADKTDITLWRGDYGYVSVYVASDEECDINIDTQCTAGLSVEVYSLDSTLAFIGHAGWYACNPKGIMPTGPKKRVDDILTPSHSAHIDENGYKCIMIKVLTARDADSGNVAINILSNGEIVSRLDCNVRVLDIEIIKPYDYTFKVEYWHHPYNVAEYYGVEPWSKEHIDILRKHQLLYKSIGGSGVICTILDEVWGGQTYSKNAIRYPSMVKWCYSKKGGWHFDYTNLDKWIDLNIELGLDDKFICYSMMPWGNKMRYYDEDKGKYIERTIPTTFRWRYKRAWRVFLEDFVRYLDEKNIFDSVYIGFDERNNMGMILDFLDTFVNKDGHHFKISASFNNYMGNKKCLDRIDSASIGLDEIREHENEYRVIAKERQRQGKFTSLYTATEHFPNSFALSVPAESYWTIMYAYATGNIGFLRWAYDAWVEDPLVDTTHWSFQAGDCFLIYPNRESKIPSLSYRLMKLDEGVRDVNKLAILAKKSELAGGISDLMRKSLKNYDYDIAYDASWSVSARKAKWATPASAREIISDVEDVKRDIVALSEKYIELTR